MLTLLPVVVRYLYSWMLGTRWCRPRSDNTIVFRRDRGNIISCAIECLTGDYMLLGLRMSVFAKLFAIPVTSCVSHVTIRVRPSFIVIPALCAKTC